MTREQILDHAREWMYSTLELSVMPAHAYRGQQIMEQLVALLASGASTPEPAEACEFCKLPCETADGDPIGLMVCPTCWNRANEGSGWMQRALKAEADAALTATAHQAAREALEQQIGDAFGVVQTILGLEDAGDDPDGLVPLLKLIDTRSRALHTALAEARHAANAAYTRGVEVGQEMAGAWGLCPVCGYPMQATEGSICWCCGFEQGCDDPTIYAWEGTWWSDSRPEPAISKALTEARARLSGVETLVEQWRSAAVAWKRSEGVIPGAGFHVACFETCAVQLADALDPQNP